MPEAAPHEPGVASEAALLERVVGALSVPEAGARARALAALRDARLLEVLVYVALNDDSDTVARRAVSVLSDLGEPADGGLGEIARRAQRGVVADEAVARLAAAQRRSAAMALYDLAADDAVTASVRREARDALRDAYPEFLVSQPPLRLLGSPILPMFGGAFFGGYTLSTIGRFAKSGVGTEIGSVGGTLIGGATGFVLGRNVSTERTFLHLSGMGWGLYSGMLAAGALVRSPSEDGIFAAGVLGEAGGWALTLLGADDLGFTAADVWVVDLSGLALTAIVSGAMGFAPAQASDRTMSGALLGAALGGVGLGVATTRHLRFEGGDVLLTGLGAVEGMWVGGYVPQLFDRDEAGLGVIIGAGAGYFVGEALAQATGFTTGDVWQMALVSAYGYALGAGPALLADAHDKTVVGSMLATGLLGMVAAGRFGTSLDYASGDYLLVPVATALAGWHAIALGAYFHEHQRMRELETVGLMLTSMGAVGLGAMGASQRLDLTPGEVAMGSVGALWGGWFGAWGAVLADSTDADALLTTLIASDVGLATSVLLVSPLVRLEPRVLAWASLVGASSAVAAALGATFVTEDGNAIIASNLVASGLGLLVGGWVVDTYFPAAPTLEDEGASSAFALAWPSFVVLTQPYVNRYGDVDGVLVQATLF